MPLRNENRDAKSGRYKSEENWLIQISDNPNEYQSRVCKGCLKTRGHRPREDCPDGHKHCYYRDNLNRKNLIGRTQPYVRERSYFTVIKRLYNISKEEIFAMLEAQNGKCAICKRDIKGKFMKNTRWGKLTEERVWQLDHDHTTNQVRGLLCGSCNAMLGYAHDNPVMLERGAEYLIRWEMHQRTSGAEITK